MNVLFVSSLFPNCRDPVRGVFNLRQIRHLPDLCPVPVVAPIAWPAAERPAAALAEVPAHEVISGLSVLHPRQLRLPGTGQVLNAFLYVASVSGSDAMRYLEIRALRFQIVRMLGKAAAIIVRSRALEELLIRHGGPGREDSRPLQRG